jgi:6-pyruvoyltetrahydropterin/6-carboxytetrahydropterin synthase
VIDFTQVKPLIREIVDSLDERWLIPGEHLELTHSTRDDGVVEINYRERYYAAPSTDIIILPVNNTSAENLAAYVGRLLLKKLQQNFADIEVHSMRMAVEETEGQLGVWYYCVD